MEKYSMCTCNTVMDKKYKQHENEYTKVYKFLNSQYQTKWN